MSGALESPVPCDVEARGLVRRYGSHTAVNGISFSVVRGEIFGLLGPNGAGKTTTLEMLEGLRRPSGGDALVLGESVLHNARAIKERIGVQLQATALPPRTTVVEAIDLFGSFYAHRRSTADLLGEFDLREKAGANAATLSGGQLQRLSIALAVVNDPDLVFLDEPTTGLDPQARLNLWEIIEKIRDRGKSVMLTSHYMEEAQRLCDRIAIMDHGEIVALDTPTRLIDVHAPGTTIEFDAPEGVTADGLSSIAGVDRVDINGRASVHTATPERVLRALLDPQQPWSGGSGDGQPAVRDLRVHQGTLEDVFINLTGKSLRP